MTSSNHFRRPLLRAQVASWTLMACLLCGCGRSEAVSETPAKQMVYVDLKTKTPVVDLATTQVPAVNPETGQRTLMPGLYCKNCERWHPTPSFETLQRTPGAALCPKHRTPLTSDGPWPTGEE